MIREHIPVHRDRAQALVVSWYLRCSVHAALAVDWRTGKARQTLRRKQDG